MVEERAHDRVRSIFSALALTGLSLATAPQGTQSQVMYLSGQAVQPTYEGYDRNPDGSHTMFFGYLNRNHEEQPHIPIGPDNFFSVLNAGETLGSQDGWQASPVNDREQPTHFYARRQKFVFGVTVPEDFGERALVWTLRRGGETHTALGKLEPDWVWLLNPDIWNGIVDPESPNQPPTIEVVGAERVTVAVGEPVVLTVSVEDDGLPEPAAAGPRGLRSGGNRSDDGPITNGLPFIRGSAGEPGRQAVLSPAVAREVGMAVTWLNYRGPGEADFAPMVSPLNNAGGTAATTARFREPGTYEVRAYADDGLYTGVRFSGVTVIVTEGSRGGR